MVKIDYLAVFVSALAAFVVGGLWYSPLLFGKTYMVLRGMDPNSATEMVMPAGEIIGEFARWLVLAFIVAHLMVRLAISDVAGALVFGGWMWLAIYTALLGSVVHEAYPWRLYVIHAGDGLAKLALICTILGLWRTR